MYTYHSWIPAQRVASQLSKRFSQFEEGFVCVFLSLVPLVGKTADENRPPTRTLNMV